jgi:hypothetical protein
MGAGSCFALAAGTKSVKITVRGEAALRLASDLLRVKNRTRGGVSSIDFFDFAVKIPVFHRYDSQNDAPWPAEVPGRQFFPIAGRPRCVRQAGRKKNRPCGRFLLPELLLLP